MQSRCTSAVLRDGKTFVPSQFLVAMLVVLGSVFKRSSAVPRESRQYLSAATRDIRPACVEDDPMDQSQAQDTCF